MNTRSVLKRNPVLKYNKKKSRSLCTTYIENNSHFLTQSSSRKWCECILKILRLAKKNGTEGEKREDKTVHHFDVIKAACDAGLKYSDLKSDGEAAPISSTAFYNIRSGKLSWKQREYLQSRRLSDEDKATIRDFWISTSRVSPTDNYIVKRASKHNPQATTLPLYFRDFSIKESFQMFKLKHPELIIARSTFHKYKPVNVKKPKSRADVCPICKEYRQFKNAIAKRPTTILSRQEEKLKAEFDFHVGMKGCQEERFAMDINTLKEKEAVVVMDFKANISLGRGPEEDSHVFFSAPQRTVFGAVAYFKQADKVYKVIFTIVSPVLKHDSLTLREMLGQCVFNHQVFQHFKVKRVNVWMDNAPQHFRNMETLGTFAGTQFSTTLNYFAEYHGKSECDRHFGWLSCLYKEKTSYGVSRDVTTTEEFIDMYTSGVRESGGHVIPSIGASFDELFSEDQRKLNVVASIWEHEGVRQFMDDITDKPGDSREEKRRKNKLRKKPFMPLPYEKVVMQVGKSSKGEEFILNYFYNFSFKTKSVRGKDKTFIQCSLKRDSTRKYEFPYTLVKERVDYVVKLGVATSKRQEFADLKRVSARQAFHAEEVEAEMEQREVNTSS